MLTDSCNPMLIDTHCHLDATEFDGDRTAVAAQAEAVGIGCIVVPAIERANFAAVAAVCRQFPVCRPACGIHPLYVDRAREDDLDVLRTTLQCEPVVALGEIGLDGFVMPRDEKKQVWWFAEQLKLAREFALPVLLHVRKAVDVILRELRCCRTCGGIAHAFNGSRQQAEIFIKLGFKLGFGGAMTYPRATRLRELAATLPLSSIVLETDAPDIPPAWRAGTRNEPAELLRIAEMLATLRGIPVGQVVAETTANARAVLPRLAPAA
jgi:TatD DNase family protein